MSAGYSKTPLVKKLGIKENFIIRFLNQPDYYPGLLKNLPNDVHFIENDDQLADLIHHFASNVDVLKKNLAILQDLIKQDGMIWISWDKTISKDIGAINKNLI